MKRIIAVMIVAMSITVFFGACVSKNDEVVKVPATQTVEKENKTTESKSNKVEPKMWTIGAGEIQRCGNDLSVSVTVREITDKEVNAYSYPAGKMMMVGFMDAEKNITFLSDSIFETKETRTLCYKDFFTNLNPINKLETTAKVKMVVQTEDGKIVWQNNYQQFSIK
jgi:hypothetical protein